MYLGVDIGGTKTLVAVLENNGHIKEQVKFLTPKNYDNWLLEFRHTLHHLEHKDFQAAGVGCPGVIDRKHGVLVKQPNLPWKHIALQRDLERAANCPVVLENDANLAGLSESMLHPQHEKVLYVTISTGIGTAVVKNRELEPNFLETEGGHVLVGHTGSYGSWEKYSAGRVLYKHFGKRLADIAPDDHAAWRYIARHIAVGLMSNCAVVQPDLVIIGGSVGTYFDNYKDFLHQELEKYKLPVVKIPRIVQAQRPEKAVIYGCYDLAKQRFSAAGNA